MSKTALVSLAVVTFVLPVSGCGGHVTDTSDSDGGVSDASLDSGLDSGLGVDGADSGGNPVDSSLDTEVMADSGTVGDAPSDAATDAAADALAADAGERAICASIAARYLPAPIIPPYAAAGFDMRGGPAHDGSEGWDPADAGAFKYDPSLEGTAPITVSQVTSVMCDPGYSITCVDPNDAGGVVTCHGLAFDGFNPQGGFAVYYDENDAGVPGNVTSIQLEAWIGGTVTADHAYRGTIEATGTNGTHESVAMGSPIAETPSGGVAAPVAFPSNAADVTDAGVPNAATQAIVNRLYAAFMAQFLPAQTPAADCFASGDCAFVPFFWGTAAELIFVPLHLDIDVVLQGPVYGLPSNAVIDVILYSDPPPISQ